MALTDLKRFIVPDVLVLDITLLALIFPPISYHYSFVGALWLGGGFWLLRVCASKILKQEALGIGDVKLAFALGLWIGPWGILPLLLVSSFSALGVVAIRKACKSSSREIPFAPFLAFGAWVAYAYSVEVFQFLFFIRNQLLEVL